VKIILVIFVLIISLYAEDTTNLEEFTLGKIVNGKVSKEAYFNRIGLPNVYVSSQCPKKGKCWPVIRNTQGKVIKSYSTSDSVGTVSSGRYKGIAYLLYSYTYGPKKNRVTKYYLVDQNLKQYDVPNGSGGLSLISKDRDLISVSKFGVYKNGVQILNNEEIDVAAISNNPQGDIAIAAVLKVSDEIIVTNLSEWKSSNIVLSKHGDRKGIISVYPKDAYNVYAAVYKNVNIYNKGLMGAHVDFSANKLEKGWIFNSAERNVGWDPDMYINDSTLHIGTKDTTNRKPVHIIVTSKDYFALGEELPKHIEGFEQESEFDLLVGAGITQVSWLASSSIGDISSDSDLEYGEVKYDIGKSLYKSIYFEGRYGSTHLSIAYLENEAEEIGGLATKASKILNFLVDFDGFIGDSTTLRLKSTKGNINGIATFVDNNTGSTKMLNNATIGTPTEFQSELVSYGAYLMMERGWYSGLEYTDYTTPSAVGFSDINKNVVLYGMDPNFEIKSYSLVFGYDEISYAKRYEVDLARFYFQGLGGIGWADYTLSSEAQQAVANTPEGLGKTINYTGSFTFNAEAEFGYIFQQRFKVARGLGYSFTAGYRAKWAGNATGQAEDDGEDDVYIEPNELELEMGRYDIWHGPYASANFIW